MHHISTQLPLFSKLPYFVSGNEDFMTWLNYVNPEDSVPECWDNDAPLSETFFYLLIINYM